MSYMSQKFTQITFPKLERIKLLEVVKDQADLQQKITEEIQNDEQATKQLLNYNYRHD